MTLRNPRHAMSSGMILQNQLEGSKDESSSLSSDASQYSGRSNSGMTLRTLGNRSRSVNQVLAGPSGSSQRPSDGSHFASSPTIVSSHRSRIPIACSRRSTGTPRAVTSNRQTRSRIPQAITSNRQSRIPIASNRQRRTKTTSNQGPVIEEQSVTSWQRGDVLATKDQVETELQLGILPHHEADFLRQTGIVEAVTRPIQSGTGNNRNWREIQLEKLPDGILIPEHGRSLEGSIYKMECHDGYTRTLQITKVLSRGDDILGRVPTVVVAKCIKEQVGRRRSKKIRCWTEMGDLIVKFSFPAATRKAENAFISEARAAAVGADAWANDHLPNIVDFETLHFPIDSPQQRLHTRFPEEYELRVARIIVMEQLHSLEELDDVKDFAQVYFDILQIHRWLVEKPRILHRDLSMSNVMFRRNADRQVLGVLNDFDLSTSVRTKGASSDSRTGTKPFMASDLLDREWERGHMYRHDLESLFYIMLIQCCLYSSPSQLWPDAKQGYRRWFIEGDHNLVKTKRAFFITPLNNPPIHLYFERFRPWVTTIHAQFARGYIRRSIVESGDPDDMALLNLSSASFDWDTLGGLLTYDSLYSIMRNFPCGDNSAETEALIVRSSTVNLT
ncbi:hypothetical protein D9757_003295 [Collybiopsis confluens]|uniref:Protein kinase domain-containing protein n=1 Tax=Collybiopsis confluens TaxID=2823264 RepID=A0A8H5HZ43_9AGAR|nr:hypothetical protein D9757_003295 [Collybiopsis confluens]